MRNSQFLTVWFCSFLPALPASPSASPPLPLASSACSLCTGRGHREEEGGDCTFHSFFHTPFPLRCP
uniref:Secreted protein n=1 Tax=Pelusios castaneus TaxID=367368 RepID=A0A8C8SN70_9SAUR